MRPFKSLARNLFGWGALPQTMDQPCKDPEPVYQAERSMTGFWATLTAEQKEKALAYRGPDNLGPPLPAE